jgi:hypothetical protein
MTEKTTVSTTPIEYAEQTPYNGIGVWGNTGATDINVGTGNVSLRVRRKTNAEWEAFSEIIPEGEPCFAIDTGELRIGDGEHYWSGLYNILGTSNIVYSDGTNRYLIIDDGELT